MPGRRGCARVDLDKARALLREAGYDGRKVVFLNATDSPTNNAVTLTMGAAMQRGGLNMDLPSMDWATLTQRRNRREPQDQGGWNLFVTIANVLDAQNPLTNLYLASPCEGGLAGWPCDAELERLRRAWWEERTWRSGARCWSRCMPGPTQVLPYISAGQYRTLSARRANIEGLRPTTVPVFWGVEKK